MRFLFGIKKGLLQYMNRPFLLFKSLSCLVNNFRKLQKSKLIKRLSYPVEKTFITLAGMGFEIVAFT